MRAKNTQIKKNKSLGKNQKSKTISTNKSASLKLKNDKRKAKSKNKELKNKGNLIKNKPKINNIKEKNLNIESNNYNNNDIINNNSYQYLTNNENNYISNGDIYNNILGNFSLNDNQMINSVSTNYNNIENRTSLNCLITSNNKSKENMNNLKISMDRLLNNSKNILQKQNIILSECEFLTKNAAMNEYSIQNLIIDDKNEDYEKLMGKYTNNISQILSKVKSYNINSDLNMKLKNENDSLKHKLEMLDINKEYNFNKELNNFKAVIVTEINHLLNFLGEIGYDNLKIDKMEIGNITSQKIIDFFQIIKKIIKQLKEILTVKETMISKMTIEQTTNRSKNNSNLDEINKSYEKLSLDYNNIGFKTYNFSVRNNIRNNTYNISFRNYQKNNKDINLLEKTQRSLNMNEYQSKNFFKNKEEKIDKNKYNENEISLKKEEIYKKINSDKNKDEKNNSDLNFNTKFILNDVSDENYQNNFLLQGKLNYKIKDEI